MKLSQGFLVFSLRLARKRQKYVDESATNNKHIFGVNCVYDVYSESDKLTPKFVRFWLWRFRLHLFCGRDPDAPHNHAWTYWTFPLTSYVEEVTKLSGFSVSDTGMPIPKYETTTNVVKRFRIHMKKPYNFHRIVGRADGRKDCPVVTLVYVGKAFRSWGFLIDNEIVPLETYVKNRGV